MTDTELIPPNSQEKQPIKPERESCAGPSTAKSYSFYLRSLIDFAIPAILTSMTWSMQGLISTYFAGRLNNVVLLDAISLGSSWSEIFGFSFICGVTGAEGTFVSQSFGKKDYRACGLMMNRAMAIVWATAVPCAVFLAFSRPIFLWVGIEPEVAKYSFYYTLVMIPNLFISGSIVVVNWFMQSQRIVTPGLVIEAINACLHPLYCYIFMFDLDWGYIGCALARYTGNFVCIIGLVVYLRYSGRCKDTLVFPTFRDVFCGWGEYFSIAIPATLMGCLEWWGMEIINLMCGRLGIVELAANTISIKILSFASLFCSGIGSATLTYVGNSLGAKSACDARAYSIVGVALTLVSALSLGGLMLLLRSFLAGLFTSDLEVIELMKTVIFIIAVYELFDGVHVTLGCILEGMGRQARASVINLFAYYALMIPIALVAAFWLNLGIYAIWISYLSSSIFVCAGFTYLIRKEDWKTLLAEVENRGKEDETADAIGV
ncbi:MAG: MATE family efflux transporter [Anaerolineaceae bacterium]|nr:MATE family efflux transporter [Anaerolineaceae bacterium]